MKFFKSKFFVICLILAIVLTLVPTLIVAFGGTDLLRSALGTVAKPFTFCASSVANAFNGFVDVFTQYDDLKKENAELREELEEYKNKEYDEELLRDHNNWLSEYINIHNSSPNLVFKEARVIAREASNTSTQLTLDRGTAHGVKKNMPVVTADGLLGYVHEVGLDWCHVLTVIEPSSSIGVYTERTGVLGVLQGNAAMYGDGLCRMTYIESDSNLLPGDRVFTAGGEKSIYPSGLLIGEIASVDVDPDTGAIMATIKPYVDFTTLSDIKGVLVVAGYKSAGE